MKLQNGRIAIVFLTEGEYIFTVCVSGLVSLIYKISFVLLVITCKYPSFLFKTLLFLKLVFLIRTMY